MKKKSKRNMFSPLEGSSRWKISSKKVNCHNNCEVRGILRRIKDRGKTALHSYSLGEDPIFFTKKLKDMLGGGIIPRSVHLKMENY